MLSDLQLSREVLADICRKWRVRELAVFGSVLREDFGPDSDVDFLVQFEPDAPWDLWHIIEMREELVRLVNRPVDIVEREALRNPYRKRAILESAEVIYAA